MAEAGGEGQEAGKGPEVGEAAEAIQGLSVAFRGAGDQILFLLAHSSERLVHDRIKNYLGKYLPTAQEVTERDVLPRASRLALRSSRRRARN